LTSGEQVRHSRGVALAFRTLQGSKLVGRRPGRLAGWLCTVTLRPLRRSSDSQRRKQMFPALLEWDTNPVEHQAAEQLVASSNPSVLVSVPSSPNVLRTAITWTFRRLNRAPNPRNRVAGAPGNPAAPSRGGGEMCPVGLLGTGPRVAPRKDDLR
jgi:hypothetical protein